jgi:hypothetical protein
MENTNNLPPFPSDLTIVGTGYLAARWGLTRSTVIKKLTAHGGLLRFGRTVRIPIAIVREIEHKAAMAGQSRLKTGEAA